MFSCVVIMFLNNTRGLLHKLMLCLQIIHGSTLKGQSLIERIFWMGLLTFDVLIKISTILLSLFVIAESVSYREILGNITAMWFLDNIDSMCANSVLASMDVFTTDISSQSDFMQFNFENRLYAKVSLYWIYFVQIIFLIITPVMTYFRFNTTWLRTQSPTWIRISSSILIAFLFFFPLSLNLFLTYYERKRETKVNALIK